MPGTLGQLDALWGGPRLTICSAQTALAFPPVDTNVGIIANMSPKGTGYSEDEFVLQIVAAGSTNLTAAVLYAMRLEPATLADQTITTTHASELVNLNSHGTLTGFGPIQFSNAGGALPVGIVAFDPTSAAQAASGRYYTKLSTANAFTLYPTREDAFAGTNNVALTGDGTGTHTVADFSDEGPNRTHRVVFAKMADLGDDVAGVLTVALTAHGAYIDGPFVHQPGTIGYAVSATLSSAVATTISAYPRKKVGR